MTAAIQAIADLLEAVESLQGTFGVIRGKTPEDGDVHTHDDWAEKFLAERLGPAREALQALRAAPTLGYAVTRQVGAGSERMLFLERPRAEQACVQHHATMIELIGRPVV